MSFDIARGQLFFETAAENCGCIPGALSDDDGDGTILFGSMGDAFLASRQLHVKA